ncbi:DUF6133 family protein [Desulfosporosinus lacus]|uniref:Uncharacterized protein n=1 Tax=Desulfosporosinus lacus DSM 15449 TaxID=1121420 RepID=A0A1M5Q800_9FIRM|nr:DUF6133 family protein [Desulfosporosinus lacus]SHH09899.1 hypothetical protein SAMN02746098_00163 [Desulfosporosinus lacus DSM 15449]
MKKTYGMINEKTTTVYFNGKGKLIRVLSNRRGESDTTGAAVKILISVVLGALILSGLYYLIHDIVLPNLNTRVEDMFDYNG